MTLKELVKNINCTITGNPETEIKGIAYDSRKVQEGYLFVAVKGIETDGHKYIESAVKNGAAAVLGEEAASCDCTYVQTEDSRKALALCGSEFYGHP